MGRAKIILVILVIILAAGLVGGALVPEDEIDSSIHAPRDNDQKIFHIRLADQNLYGADGTYTDSFEVSRSGGMYEFDFVPNGSSPENLSIMLKNQDDGTEYHQNFVLEGTEHEAILGEYYTWEYQGQSQISIPTAGTVHITIDPNGNTQGSVSVYLYE